SGKRGQLRYDPGDDRGPVLESLQTLHAARVTEIGDRIERGLLKVFIAVGPGASAQQVNGTPKLGIVEQRGADARIVLECIDELVRAVGYEHMIMVEKGIEPQTDEMMHPVAIEIVV